jgi:hypothetical protein
MGALSRYLVLFEPPSAARYTLASFGVVWWKCYVWRWTCMIRTRVLYNREVAHGQKKNWNVYNIRNWHVDILDIDTPEKMEIIKYHMGYQYEGTLTKRKMARWHTGKRTCGQTAKMICRQTGARHIDRREDDTCARKKRTHMDL